MRRATALLCIGACIGFASCATAGKQTPRADMSVTTDAFAPNHPISRAFTCDGANVAPAVAWSAPPAKTAELAIVMVDQDVDAGHFVHWLLYGIPASARRLGSGATQLGARAPSGASASPSAQASALPSGARVGTNSFGHARYEGPCPPKGQAHRYTIVVFALKRKTKLGAGATFEALDRLQAVLDRGQITGTYTR